jgi:hypothetical protein
MRLSETEALFVEAVQREFGFLVVEYGFVEKPVTWNGEGISVSHVGPVLEVSNFLEAEQNYATFIFPLRDGARLPIFDAEMDERFTYFFVEDLLSTSPPPKGVGSEALSSRAELLNSVAARAAVLRDHIGALSTDDGTMIAAIRDRMRVKHLRDLVQQWTQFVQRVRRGYEGTGPGYVAGVNVRGAIRSLVSWSGNVPREMERELREADAQFDAATDPVALEPGSVRVLPHPRATRWFRRPKGGGSLVGRELLD